MMTNILILDDDRDTRELLEEELLADFPDARIDTTDNLAGAIGMVRRLAATGEHYDVALLDARVFRDSKDRGEPALHPEARRELLGLLTYLTVVINHSVYAESADVRRCILEELREPNGPVPVLVYARPESPWHQEVRQLVRRAVYGRRVGAQIERLIQLKPSGFAAALTGSARSIGAGGFLDLEDLARDIKLHWDDLGTELQARVQKVFRVRRIGDDILVTL